MERRERFDLRLLDLESDFYDYIERNGLNRSAAVRHFIRQGISEKNGFTLQQQKELLNEVVELKRQLRGVGTNLNQISKYFNINNYLLESDLAATQRVLMEKQKEITKLLNTLISKM